MPLRLALALLLMTACGTSPPEGVIGRPCRADRACDDGLVCFRGVCALAEPPRDAGVDAFFPPDAFIPPDAHVETDAGLVPARPPLSGDATGPALPRPREHTHRGLAGFFDVALDWERHRLFISHGRGGGVDVLDLDTAESGTLSIGSPFAEHLFFDPYRDEILVTLPDAYHSAFWFDSDGQHGHITTIDPASLVVRPSISIPHDPWQIVGDGRGHAFVTGASGQWTHIGAVDLDTGAFASAPDVYHVESLALHPSRDHAYGARTEGISPGEVRRFDFAGGAVVHGPQVDAESCGELRIAPDGASLTTRCGAVYSLASEHPSMDVVPAGSMGDRWDDAAYHPGGHRFFALHGRTLEVYDSSSQRLLASIVLPAVGIRVLAAPDYLVLAYFADGGMPEAHFEVRWYESL